MKRSRDFFQAVLVLIMALLIIPANDVLASQAATKKTIAVAELRQETNLFSPVLTTRRDFEAAGLILGDAIIPYCRKKDKKGRGTPCK